MRKLIIALALTTALAAPATARDGSAYVGVEGGLLVLDKSNWDYSDATLFIDNAYDIRYKKGLDADLIAGYDLGALRVEGELGYKRASAREAFVSNLIEVPTAADLLGYDVDGRSTALSLMLNGLFDFGDGAFSGYLGGGVGVARVKQRILIPSLDRSLNGRDSGVAYQLIGGVRYAATPNVDIGLKYRMFNVNNLKYEVDEPAFEIDAGNWRSNSLLASIVYNFAAPVVVAPPPPVIVEEAPPPPPATQTCPDGSVILATDVCPAPPPPPPPPAPTPERG